MPSCQEAIATLLKSLHGAGVAAKAAENVHTADPEISSHFDISSGRHLVVSGPVSRR